MLVGADDASPVDFAAHVQVTYSQDPPNELVVQSLFLLQPFFLNIRE